MVPFTRSSVSRAIDVVPMIETMPCTSINTSTRPKARIIFWESLRLLMCCNMTCFLIPFAGGARSWGPSADVGEPDVGRRAHRDLGAAGVALDAAADAHVLAPQFFGGRGEGAADAAGDARGEGVAREVATHVEERRLALGVGGVAGALDGAADHPGGPDEAHGVLGGDGLLRRRGEGQGHRGGKRGQGEGSGAGGSHGAG